MDDPQQNPLLTPAAIAQVAQLVQNGQQPPQGALQSTPTPTATLTHPEPPQVPPIGASQNTPHESSPASPPLISPPNSNSPPSIGTPDQSRLQGYKTELQRRIDTGSGISQIHSKIEGALPNHPFLGKVLGWGAQVPAMIGDSLLRTVNPLLDASIPGTSGHHSIDVAQSGNRVAADESQNREEAQTQNLNLQPQLKQAQGALAQEKQDEVENNHHATQQANHDKYVAGLREHGLAPDESDPTGTKLRPLKYEEMSEPQQAVYDLKGAQEETERATADLKRAQADPNSSVYKLAQQRLQSAQEAHVIALQRLGLSEKQFEMRSQGTVNGVAPAGAMIADDGRSVGTAFQQNVRPTTTQRDAAGRAQIGESIRKRLLTQLQDPAIRAQIGPIMGRAKNAEEFVGALPANLAEFGNDLKSYAAFQAGMHPVRGIGGLQYFDKVMGGLGQTPEQMMGKFQSNHNTAMDVEKLGTPNTAGSNAAQGGQDMITVQIPGQPPGQIHSSQKAAFLAKYPNAKVQ